MSRVSWVLRIALAWAALASAWAQLPAPRLLTVFPPGGAAGSTVEVTVAGSDLDEAVSLVFSEPGVTGVPVPGASDRFRVTLPANLPEGLLDLRVLGRHGLSNPRAFSVGAAGTERSWKETPSSPEKAFDLPLESVVQGRLGAQEVLWFRFRGEAGQALGARLEASGLDSRLVPDLALTDAAGHEVARVRRREWFDFRLPSAGTYLLRLNDSLYRGGDTHGFRLRLTARPRVAFAVPMVLQAGRPQRVTLYGRRLPGGVPSPVLGPDGESWEQREVEVLAPATPDDPQATVAVLPAPASTPLASGVWLWRGSGAAGPAPAIAPLEPVPWALTALPVVTAAPTGLVQVTPPCEVSGLFPERGQAGGVVFDAKTGEVFQVELTSERWGFPVDPMAVVQRAKPGASPAEAVSWVDVLELGDTEQNLGDREFRTAHRDAAARWKVEEGGRHRIVVRDGFRRGDGQARFPYRLSLRRESPDFQLAVFPMPPPRAGEDRSIAVVSPSIRRDQTLAFRVVAFRQDGFDGDIRLGAIDLPSGVGASAPRIAAGQNTGVLLLSAGAGATGSAPWRLVGTATLGAGTLVRTASVASVVWPVADFNNENPVVRRTRGTSLAVVTAESAPVTLRVGTATPSADGATWKLPLHLERRGEFQGAFNVKAGGHAALDKAKEIPIPEKATNLVAELALGEARLPNGTHTLWLQGSLAGKYRQAPEAVAVAEAELKAAEQALASAKPEGKPAAEARKKEAEARKKAADEKAKPRDVTVAVWSEPFTVTVGAVPAAAGKESKP
jgi:hypothetical protein